MSIAAMEAKIRSFPDKDLGAGAPMTLIGGAESNLGAQFPESYRHFLTRYGWARFAHQEIYGLGEAVPSHQELVANTLSERSLMRPYLPPTFVPVMNDGAGNHYCLDTSRLEGGECPVIFWDHEAPEDQDVETVAPSFDVWLIGLLDDL